MGIKLIWLGALSIFVGNSAFGFAAELPNTSAGTPALTTTDLGGIENNAELFHKAAKALDDEMNRHAEIATWNGIFGEPNMACDQYSTFDSEPIGPGLGSDCQEGPLLPPREDFVQKNLADIKNSLQSICGITGYKMPSSGNAHENEAQWEVLQSTSTSAKNSLEQLNAMTSQDDYDQDQAAKLTRQLLNDSIGIHRISSKLQKLVKHDTQQ